MERFTVRLSSSHKPSGNTRPLVFKNPVLTASGTFGYGVEFAGYGDLTHLGGIVVKGLSLKPRPGNPLPRVAETPCGMLNAVGLQNDGVESFLKSKLPRLPWHETPVIANLYATSPAEFAELAGILAAEEGIAGLEVNISCPNVKNGGVLFGQDPALAAEVTEAVKKHAGNLPVIVKLSPNVTDITVIAKAAEQAMQQIKFRRNEFKQELNGLGNTSNKAGAGTGNHKRFYLGFLVFLRALIHSKAGAGQTKQEYRIQTGHEDTRSGVASQEARNITHNYIAGCIGERTHLEPQIAVDDMVQTDGDQCTVQETKQENTNHARASHPHCQAVKAVLNRWPYNVKQ